MQDTSRVASYKTKSLPFQHHEAMLTAPQTQHITTLDYIKTTIILHIWTAPIMMSLLSRCALHESNMRTPRAGFGMACAHHSTREQGSMHAHYSRSHHSPSPCCANPAYSSVEQNQHPSELEQTLNRFVSAQ